MTLFGKNTKKRLFYRVCSGMQTYLRYKLTKTGYPDTKLLHNLGNLRILWILFFFTQCSLLGSVKRKCMTIYFYIIYLFSLTGCVFIRSAANNVAVCKGLLQGQGCVRCLCQSSAHLVLSLQCIFHLEPGITLSRITRGQMRRSVAQS